MVKSIGPAFLKRNLNRLMTEESCLAIIKENKPEEEDEIHIYAKAADKIISDCQLDDIEMVSILSPDYPQQLMEISDPPSVLYVKGNKSLLKKVIAIIGTRQSTPLGNNIAERLGQYFSNQYSICNGLVEGIDEHSIYVDGIVLQNVVGIISGGLCYKETCSNTHIRVIEDVLKAGGLIISEFVPHQKEDKFSGSKASRIQAGLSHGLILVQSKIDGGSKYTLASYAKLERTLGVIHFPNSEEYKTEVFGANRLIIEKQKEGVAEIIGLKKTNNIKLRSIITIESKADYETFSSRIGVNTQNSMFVF